MCRLSCSAVPHFVLTPSRLEPCLHGLCLMRCSQAMLLAVHVRAQHLQQLHLPHMTKRGDAAEKGQKQEWAFAEFSGLSCAVHCARVLAVHASRQPHATAACASFCSPLCLRIVCPHRRSRLSRADASRSSPSRPGGLNCHRLRFGFMPFLAVFPVPETVKTAKIFAKFC